MRQNFSNRKVSLSLPDLSSVQLESYDWLKKSGINEILDELGTMEDYSGRGWVLHLSSPTIEKENISVESALHNGRTYDAPWYLTAAIEDPIAKKNKKQTLPALGHKDKALETILFPLFSGLQKKAKSCKVLSIWQK